MSKLQEFKAFNDKFNKENADCYRLANGKVPIDGRLLPFDEVAEESSYNVAWLVQRPYIVVDIDDKESAKLVNEILSEKGYTYGLNTSPRGAHFIFKNTDADIGQGAHLDTAIGIEIDIRRADKGNITMPLNDDNRKFGPIPDGEVDEIPYFLKPQKSLKEVPNFIEVGDEGGRNDALYNHYLKLGSHSKGLTAVEIEGSIRIINEYLFSESLTEDEMKATVLRPENQEKVQEGVKSSSLTRIDKLLLLAETIVSEKHLVTAGNMMYEYRHGYYHPMKTDEVHDMIFNDYVSNISTNDRNEVVTFMKMKTKRPVEDLDREWHVINTKQGRFNLIEKKLYPHTWAEVDTIRVPRIYDPQLEKSEIIEDLLDFFCDGDDNKRTVILEMVGYCLLKDNIYQKAYMLYGTGSNGKSTLMNIISRMLDDNNVSNIEIEDLNKDCKALEMAGKLANVADDINLSTIQSTNVLKKVISGEPITVDVKYEKPVTFRNYATMIFTTNKIPRSKDTTFGFYRRFMVIDFMRQVENPDPTLMLRITKNDLDYLFTLAVDAIHEVLKRKKLTEYAKSESLKNTYMRSVSSIGQFIEEFEYNVETLEHIPVKDTYDQYKHYCDMNGFKKMNSQSFKFEMQGMFGLVYRKTTNTKGTPHTKPDDRNVVRWVIPRKTGEMDAIKKAHRTSGSGEF